MSTICAISTPHGIGGIAVIRVSGPQAISAVDSMWKGKSLAQATTHTAHLGQIIRPDGTPLDQAVATVYRTPRSFTGDDTVEISVHGSLYIQQELLRQLIHAGCRMAEPGEFTRRAFIAGHMDLAQADAIADLIAARSRAAHRLAMQQMRGAFSRRLAQLRQNLLTLASLLELELDFSEEDVEFADRTHLSNLATEIKTEVDRLNSSFAVGNAIRTGVPVAIVGAPNVGKSSLLNRLLGDDRAIVSDIPGTTRDTVEDTTDIDGITFRFIDTAGLRSATDPIERLGIARSHDALRKARIVISLAAPAAKCDTISFETGLDIPADTTVIYAVNKADLLTALRREKIQSDASAPLLISTRTGEGLDALRKQLVDASGAGSLGDDGTIVVTNARHAAALTAAAAALERFLGALRTGLPTDLAAQDLREVLHHLGTITGAVTTPDILSTVFSRFCIGK